MCVSACDCWYDRYSTGIEWYGTMLLHYHTYTDLHIERDESVLFYFSEVVKRETCYLPQFDYLGVHLCGVVFGQP